MKKVQKCEKLTCDVFLLETQKIIEDMKKTQKAKNQKTAQQEILKKTKKPLFSRFAAIGTFLHFVKINLSAHDVF